MDIPGRSDDGRAMGAHFILTFLPEFLCLFERQDCREVPARRSGVYFSNSLSLILIFKRETMTVTIITILIHAKSVSKSFTYINSVLTTTYKLRLSLSLLADDMRLRIMLPTKTSISSPLPGMQPISCAHGRTQYMSPPLLLLLGFRSFWKA